LPVEDFGMLSLLVIKERRPNELQANRPYEVVTSNELPIGGRYYLEPFQAGEELYAQGV
jgi:hypothetical protein